MRGTLVAARVPVFRVWRDRCAGLVRVNTGRSLDGRTEWRDQRSTKITNGRNLWPLDGCCSRSDQWARDSRRAFHRPTFGRDKIARQLVNKEINHWSRSQPLDGIRYDSDQWSRDSGWALHLQAVGREAISYRPVVAVSSELRRLWSGYLVVRSCSYHEEGRKR